MKSKEYLQEIRKMNDDINKKIMDLHELKIMSKKKYMYLLIELYLMMN